MASFTEDQQKISDEFSQIKELYDRMSLKNSKLKI